MMGRVYMVFSVLQCVVKLRKIALLSYNFRWALVVVPKTVLSVPVPSNRQQLPNRFLNQFSARSLVLKYSARCWTQDSAMFIYLILLVKEVNGNNKNMSDDIARSKQHVNSLVLLRKRSRVLLRWLTAKCRRMNASGKSYGQIV